MARYCVNCGAEISNNHSFCTRCGTGVDGKKSIYQTSENQSTKTETNVFSIIGLICSILIGGITGLVFSIIGLIKSKEINNGKEMAIAGIIISALKIVWVIFTIGITIIRIAMLR